MNAQPAEIEVMHGDPPQRVADDGNNAFPYFGIVPRALMAETRSLNCGEWLAVASKVEASRRGLSVRGEATMERWRDQHDEHDVASWHASRAACVRYLDRLRRDDSMRHLLPNMPAVDAPWQLWQIKEGHTTSVWRASAQACDGSQTRLCINLARDRSASTELQVIASMMQRWRERDPVHIAPILRADCVEVREGGRAFGLTATVGPWLDGCELHLERGHGCLRLLEVAHFVNDEGGGPQRIAGWRLGEVETRDLLKQWQRLVVRLAAACPGRPNVLAPRFDFADGDFVLCGRRLVAIACDADWLNVPAKAWAAFKLFDDPFAAYQALHEHRFLAREAKSV